jgi:hypothetical protein
MSASLRWVVALSLIASCGDGETAPDLSKCSTTGGENCFAVPTAAIIARNETPGFGSRPTLGCGPLVPHTVTANALEGRVYDYQHGINTGIPRATLSFYSTVDEDSELATGTADDSGDFSVTLPPNTPDILFAHQTAPTTIDEQSYYIRAVATGSPEVLEFDVAAVTQDFVDEANGLVRVTPRPGAVVAVATIQDCDHFNIEHAEVVVSTASGSRSFVDGISTVYGVKGALPIPVTIDVRGDTNDNGVAGIFNIPTTEPGTLYIQAWGFIDDDAVARGADGLSLLAEYPINTFVANTGFSLPMRVNL